MRYIRGHFRCVGIALGLLFLGCITTIGPEVVPVEPISDPPILRLGSVEEEITGTLAQYPNVKEVIRSTFRAALQKPGAASLFSSDPSSLTLDIHLRTNHQADEPRLAALALFSILTFGVIPAYYYSEWDVQCDVNVVSSEGVRVAEYHLTEKGTYRIFAFPPTMFTLLGAGIQGDADFLRMAQKTSNNLSGKLVLALANDYPRLAKARAANVPSLSVLGGGPNALLARGRVHLQEGRAEEARADMMRYAEYDVRLLGALNSATVLDFYNADRRRVITFESTEQAREAERKGLVLDAFQLYQRAYGWSPGSPAEIAQLQDALIRLYPELPQKVKLPEAARRFFLEGQELEQADDALGAAVAFEKVTKIAPWFPLGYYNLALLQAETERYDSAVASMETFLELAPGSKFERVARDRVYEWRGRSPASHQ